MQGLVLAAMMGVTGIACDTYEQLALLVEKARISQETAVQAVNAEMGYPACAPITLVFPENTRTVLGEVTVNGIAYEMVAVVAVQAAVPGEPPRPIKPVAQFYLHRIGPNT